MLVEHADIYKSKGKKEKMVEGKSLVSSKSWTQWSMSLTGSMLLGK